MDSFEWNADHRLIDDCGERQQGDEISQSTTIPPQITHQERCDDRRDDKRKDSYAFSIMRAAIRHDKASGKIVTALVHQHGCENVSSQNDPDEQPPKFHSATATAGCNFRRYTDTDSIAL